MIGARRVRPVQNENLPVSFYNRDGIFETGGNAVATPSLYAEDYCEIVFKTCWVRCSCREYFPAYGYLCNDGFINCSCFGWFNRQDMRHVHFIEFHIDNAVGEDWLAVYKYVA